MKKNLFRKGMKTLSLSFLAATLLLFASCSKENLNKDVQDQGSRLKTDYYQCWKAGGGVSCTNGSGGNYKVHFSNCSDFVAGKGYSTGGTTMSWSGGCSGCGYFGVYGWCRSPLTEYYIGRGGGTNCGTYSTSKGTYTLNTVQCNGANLNGSGNFHQYNCSGNSGSGINVSQHFSGWSARGHGTSSPAYCIVASEAWGGASGDSNTTVN